MIARILILQNNDTASRNDSLFKSQQKLTWAPTTLAHEHDLVESLYVPFKYRWKRRNVGCAKNNYLAVENVFCFVIFLRVALHGVRVIFLARRRRG